MPESTLSARALGRATLARHMLLGRARVSAVQALERLFALQAQLARPPFLGLWSRLAGFRREELAEALQRREVVRATLLRGTLHLVRAADYAAWRAALQPTLDRGVQSILRERTGRFDLDALIAEARAYFAEPRTFDAFREHLLAADPSIDARAMAYTARCKLPLVQVPDASAWSFPGAAAFTRADLWLGAPVDRGEPGPRGLVSRYLAAFGPASAADMQTWSGLAGLRESFAALRPALQSFRDERGRELFDLPDAPRPDPDAPAPVRLLPEFDALVLGHDDRTRLIDDAHRAAIFRPNLRILPTFLIDGRVAGTWKLTRAGKTATLTLEAFAAPTKPVRDELAAEAEQMLRFAEPDATSFDVKPPGAAAGSARGTTRRASAAKMRG